MNELYNENFKPAKTEVETGIIKWQNIPCQSIIRVNIVRTIISPKAIYGFNAFPIKIPVHRNRKTSHISYGIKKGPR